MDISILAHVGVHEAGWLASAREGFLHPILGWDHLIAMVGVGLVSHRAGRAMVVRVPAVFVACLCLGAAVGMNGFELVGLESVIASSVFVLALSCIVGSSGPAWALLFATAVFGAAHGIAHGLEVPMASHPVPYVIGFCAASALAHLTGIGISLTLNHHASERVAPVGFAAIGASLCAASVTMVFTA
jgi:urease accessory protein